MFEFSPQTFLQTFLYENKVKYPEEGEEKKPYVICTMVQNFETGVQRRSL